MNNVYSMKYTDDESLTLIKDKEIKNGKLRILIFESKVNIWVILRWLTYDSLWLIINESSESLIVMLQTFSLFCLSNELPLSD